MKLINVLEKYQNYLPKNYKVDYVMLDVYNNINVIYYKNYDRNKNIITEILEELNIVSMSKLNTQLKKIGLTYITHYFDKHIYYHEIVSLDSVLKENGKINNIGGDLD